MTKAYPIPAEALDDRLAILGTSGSGKTYLTLGAMERLLSSGARVVGVDPLGVMWGLRLMADGKTASKFNVPIFGGRHGDLPLTEHAGALIGETVATMRESCIVDLSELATKSAERRFMTAFLEALYRHTDPDKVDPYHLIIDEADRFAPQKPPAGDETMLNRMEEIVRRGRVRGFIPWLITQRPAVLNKNVLSQADGLVMLRLTSSQDRDQVGAWIEGQADRAQGKAILGSLPAMQRGQGVVWIPARGVLATVQFPTKATFDSSAAPKRGERRGEKTALRALDLGALKERLAVVEKETKANDPAALKAEVRRLSQALATAEKQGKVSPAAAAADPRASERARAEGIAAGWAEGWTAGWRSGHKAGCGSTLNGIGEVMSAIRQEIAGPVPPGAPPPPRSIAPNAGRAAAAPPPGSTSKPTAAVPTRAADGLSSPQRRVLASIGFWHSVGNDAPTRAQVGGVAAYSPSSGGFNNLLGQLNSLGLTTIPRPGTVALAEGVGYDALTPAQAREQVYRVLSPPQRKLVDASVKHGGPMTRDELAEATGYSASSGGFNNLIGSLCTLTIFEKPSPGSIDLSDWAREVLT